MEVTVYELLGMIKDGKVPKKIKIDDDILTLSKTSIIQYNFSQLGFGQLNWDYFIENYKLDEKIVEILDKDFKLEEEKKIPLKINKIIPSQNFVISDSKNNSVDERLEIIRKRLYANELYMLDIANTLNEIIDYLKSKGDE